MDNEKVSEKSVDNKSNLKWAIIYIVIIALVVTVVLLIINGNKGKVIKSELDAAAKYSSELDYSAAISAYENVVGKDPSNTEAYLGLVINSIYMDNNEAAYNWAKEGFEKTGDERLQNFMLELEALLESYTTK